MFLVRELFWQKVKTGSVHDLVSRRKLIKWVSPRSFANILICVTSAYSDFELKVRQWLRYDPVETLLNWIATSDIFCEVKEILRYDVSKHECLGLLDPELIQTDTQIYLGQN